MAPTSPPSGFYRRATPYATRCQTRRESPALLRPGIVRHPVDRGSLMGRLDRLSTAIKAKKLLDELQ
jgi:hypothetical protein